MAAKQMNQAAVAYVPVSPPTRNARATSTAEPIPAKTLRNRAACIAYQPCRNTANNSTGKVLRSEVSQNAASRRTSTKHFHGGCSGSRSRSARYRNRKAHHTGRMFQVAYSPPKESGKVGAGMDESHW